MQRKIHFYQSFRIVSGQEISDYFNHLIVTLWPTLGKYNNKNFMQ